MNSRFHKLLAVSLGGCLVLGGMVAIGQVRKDTTRVETRTQSKTQILRSSVVVGSVVTLEGGAKFGKVNDFVFTPEGCIDYAIVLYEDRYYPVPWTFATYSFTDRIVALDISRDVILQAPTFTQFTEFSNRQFVEKVNTHFRLDERRDRRDTRTRDRDGDARDRDRDPGDAKKPGTPRDTDPKKPAPPRDSADPKKPAPPRDSADPKKPAPPKDSAEPKPAPPRESTEPKKPGEKRDDDEPRKPVEPKKPEGNKPDAV